MKETPILRSIPGACEALGVSRTTIYNLIGEGRLHTVKIGKLVRIEEQALRDFVAGLRDNAAAESQPLGGGN